MCCAASVIIFCPEDVLKHTGKRDISSFFIFSVEEKKYTENEGKDRVKKHMNENYTTREKGLSLKRIEKSQHYLFI